MILGAVILSKVDGANVTELEARHLLQNYGPLELVALTTTPNRRTGNMVPGVFVRFAYYLDCRDALRVSYSLFSVLLSFITFINFNTVLRQPQFRLSALHGTFS